MTQLTKPDINESSTKQTSQVVLGPADEKEIEDFLKGNLQAAGKVYARAACILSNGLLLPEPLLSVISKRLECIGFAILDSSGQDKQRAIYKAALPVQKRGRPAKKNTLKKLLIEEIHDLTRHLKGKARDQKRLAYAIQLENEFKGKSTQPITAKNLMIALKIKK